MKKILIRIALLLSLLVLVWLGASWFVGLKTERFVRDTLSVNNLRYVGHTLVDYQRGLFSAQAVTRIDVRETPLGIWTDALQFRHTIRHGPLIWNNNPPKSGAKSAELLQQKLLIALSYWQTELDTTGQGEDFQQLLNETFNEPIPFDAVSLLGYGQQLTYQATLSDMENETEAAYTFQFGGVQFSGTLNPRSDTNNSDNTLYIDSGQLSLANDDGRLTLPFLAMVMKTDPLDAERTIYFATEQAGLHNGDTSTPVLFDASGTIGYYPSGSDVRGRIELGLDMTDSVQSPLQKVDFNAELSGLHSAGLQLVNQRQNQLQDIQVRLRWNEDDIETPEARREQRQLKLQSTAKAAEVLKAIFSHALQQDKSRVQYQFNLQTTAGNLQQSANLVYTGNNNPRSVDDLLEYTWADWARLLRGRIKLDAAKAIFPPAMQALLDYPLETQAIRDEGGHYRMDLHLTGYDIELNERVWAYDHLDDKFMARNQRVNHAADSGMTAKVMARIEQQGLTSELLQELELSGEVSVETLQLLRQLKFMNEELQ